jgi:hypothetical protein
MEEQPQAISPPEPPPSVAEKLTDLRARYALGAQQRQTLAEQQQVLAEQLRQVEAALPAILGAIMALEELSGQR